LLKTVGEEFHLAAPTAALDKAFKVTQPRYGDTLELSLDWPEAEDCAKILNRLVDLFMQQSAQTRQREIALARLRAAEQFAEARFREAEKARNDAQRTYERLDQRIRELDAAGGSPPGTLVEPEKD